MQAVSPNDRCSCDAFVPSRARGLRPGAFGKIWHTRKRRKVHAVSVAQEREVLTTLLDDVAKLHEVAETLPADDKRAQDLELVANHRLASAPGMRRSIAAALLGLSEPTWRACSEPGTLRILTP